MTNRIEDPGILAVICGLGLISWLMISAFILFMYTRFISIPIKNIKCRKEGYTICIECLGSGIATLDKVIFKSAGKCPFCNGTGKKFWIDKIIGE